MKINLTKKEYRLLVEMLYLSDWVMHSHHIENQQVEHEKIKRKLLSYYKEMESDDIIEYSKTSDDYFETAKLDEQMLEKFILPYEEEVFWDELIDRLGERDAIRKIGIEEYQSMDGIERVMKVEEIKELYANEFEHHGLENVTISYEPLVKN